MPRRSEPGEHAAGMRILLVYPPAADETGGVQTWLGQLRSAWTEDSVEIVEPKARRHPARRDRRALGVAALNARVVIAGLLRRPDVVVFGHLASAWGARALSRLRRVPYVVIAHGTEIRGRTVWRSVRRSRAILDGAAIVIANSAFTKDQVRRLGVSTRIVVRHPGVGTGPAPGADGRQALRDRWGLGNGSIILTVARLVSHKGHDVAIRALPAIRTRVPDASYVIVGRGPCRHALADLASAHGVGSAVHFLEDVEDGDLSGLYRASDAFLLLSREVGDAVEGYGIVLLEAGSAGLPVVASRSGGIPEAVIEGVTGLLVDPLDADGVAESVVRTITEPGLARRLGSAARQLAETEWDWRARAERIRCDLLACSAP